MKKLISICHLIINVVWYATERCILCRCLKLIEKWSSPPFVKYFVNNGKLLHKVMREDDKTFHALVVPTLLAKYVLHEAHDALGTMVHVQLEAIDM